jgi:two-component system, NarL family, response regulator
LGDIEATIAASLSMTEEAVKGQIKNIFSKLVARDRTHAALIALHNGIIQGPASHAGFRRGSRRPIEARNGPD